MFGILRTLIAGANARAEEKIRDTYSVELIEQKIREATTSLKAAKVSLAGMIQRKRSEERQAETLRTRIDGLTLRIRDALAAGDDTLAQEAAVALATMENEMVLRRETIRQLEVRVVRLETSVEGVHRRIVDLKQGAIAAKSVKREQDIQARLGHTGNLSGNAMDEAEALIASIMQRDDPFEHSEILREIESGLNHDTLEDRMAAKGFGPTTKLTAADILARFK